MSKSVDQFYAEHIAGGPTHVVLSTAVLKDGTVGRVEVFSTLDKARAWSESLSEDVYSHCVHGPHIIDVPEAMTNETPNPISIHIDSSEKAKHLPEYRQDLPCPTCGAETETGFGLAGGGYGIYSMCPKCGVVVSKSVTED